MTTKVLVLGCGPAGLMAAHAAAMYGAEVRILSRKQKSVIGGAQFLHLPMPGINRPRPETFITIRKVGTREGYAQKVYGDPNRHTSWNEHHENHMLPAWDLRATYDLLWEVNEDRIQDGALDPAWLRDIISGGVYDLIVSTIPAPAICQRQHDQKPHVFKKQKVLIDMDTMPPEDNVILWNGLMEDRWYRCSRVFGTTGGYEYPLGSIVHNAHVARKPLFTDCDCFPEVLRAGRYGAWDKKLLTHHAFTAVTDRLKTHAMH